MSRPARFSKRFRPSGWTERLIPLLLVLLCVLLVGTFIFLFLALAGLLP